MEDKNPRITEIKLRVAQFTIATDRFNSAFRKLQSAMFLFQEAAGDYIEEYADPEDKKTIKALTHFCKLPK